MDESAALLSDKTAATLGRIAADRPEGSVVVLEDPTGSLGVMAGERLAGHWTLPGDVHLCVPESGRWTVAEIRELILAPLVLVPEHRHVLVIDAADEIDLRSSEKLLKTLEEPPVPASFLLVVRERARLLSTILSRASVVVRLEPSEPTVRLDALVASGVEPERAGTLLELCGPLVDLPAMIAAKNLDDIATEVFSERSATSAGSVVLLATSGRTAETAKLAPAERSRLRQLLAELCRRRELAIAARAHSAASQAEFRSVRQALEDLRAVEHGMRTNTPVALLVALLRS